MTLPLFLSNESFPNFANLKLSSTTELRAVQDSDGKGYEMLQQKNVQRNVHYSIFPITST